MVRPMPSTLLDLQSTVSSTPIPLALGLFVSVTILVAVCAKQGRQAGEKSLSETGSQTRPKAAFGSPKRLMATISHKAMVPLLHAKKIVVGGKGEEELAAAAAGAGAESGGVWRKAILMGEKCQPLEFSGVIFYDYEGNRVSEMPKSPCRGASPLRNFDFLVQTSDRSVR